MTATKFASAILIVGWIMCAADFCPAAAGSGGPPQAVPLKKVYSTMPEYDSGIKGYFSSGIVLADLNRDGREDMIVANGIDMAPQSLSVYYNGLPKNKLIFHSWPDWFSHENGYMNGLAVGDIDGDGWLDVAVAFAFDGSRDISTGGVKVFFNRAGQLEPSSRFQTAPDGFLPLGCALADVDADGDLDLVVPAVLEGKGVWGGTLPPSFALGRARIYLNDGGALSPKPAWTSSQRLGASSVVAADINQDGWMDLAFGAPRTAVYYGGPPQKAGEVPLPEQASWMSTNTTPKTRTPLEDIDAGFPGKAQGAVSTVPAPAKERLMLAVSPGCGTNLDAPCKSPLFIYIPDRGTVPVWLSEDANFASGNLLGDFNGDGFLDLANAQWGTQFPGGPLWLFQGPLVGSPPGKPALTINVKQLWKDFSATNLQCPGSNPTLRHSFKIAGTAAVLTLPQRIVAGVEEVARDGQPIPRSDWAWAPGTNWVSLKQHATPGQSLTVTYKVPMMLDLASTSWNPGLGNDLFLSFLKVCP